MDCYKVVFTPPADADLDEIVDYVAADNPQRAISFIEELRGRAVKTLSAAPKSGTRFGTARFFVFGDYVVVYDVDDEAKTVVVHMITQGRRQWQSLIGTRL